MNSISAKHRSQVRVRGPIMNYRIKSSRGFTMTDVVVGTAIAAVIMAVAVCTFASACTARDTLRCHDNLELIANLEMIYKTQNSNHAYTAVTSSLNTVVPGLPVCPNGGVYSVTISTGAATAQNGQVVPNGKIVISCSCAGHGKYAPEIDTP